MGSLSSVPLEVTGIASVFNLLPWLGWSGGKGDPRDGRKWGSA